MARPTVIQTETILEAARQVFLEKGVQATSAEVAERAGVSEGSIFKRFKTKSELFQAAMGMDVRDLPRGLELLPTLAGENTVQVNLVAAAHQTIVFFEKLMPIMMMRWANPKNSLCTGLETDDPPPLRAQKHVADYLERESALGRLSRSVHAPTVARAFLGALSSYVFSELIAKETTKVHIQTDRYVEEYVRPLLEGMIDRTARDRVRAVAEPPPSRQGGADDTPLRVA